MFNTNTVTIPIVYLYAYKNHLKWLVIKSQYIAKNLPT
jgi:hypothetical protein